MTDLRPDGAAVAPDAPEAWGEPLTKTVSWYDPEIALAARATMTGLEYIHAVKDGRLPTQAFASMVGFQVVEAIEGRVTVHLDPDASLLNTNGMLHGGVLCTLMDAAVGLASLSTLPMGQATATVELKVSFLRAISPRDGTISAVGNILRAGRRITYAEGHAYGADGVLVGHASATLATIGINPPR